METADAEDEKIPIPAVTISPFITMQSPWMAQAADESAARQIAKGEEERHAREEAEHPAGECNEEVEGCGPDPSHGTNPWNCKIWVSWGKGLHLNEYLAVHGHWSCGVAPPDMEVEIALLEVVDGKYLMVHQADKIWLYPGELGPTGSEFSKGWACIANVWYQAWVWGRTWDAWTGSTNWYATAEDGHKEQCEEGLGEDPTSGPPDGDN
jgi:hypothetical protein